MRPFILSRLDDNSIDVVTLYNEILTPALYAEYSEPDKRDSASGKNMPGLLLPGLLLSAVSVCY
jgi:hypothetical protein